MVVAVVVVVATSIREVWIDVRDESLRATRVVDRLLILTCVSLAATIALTIVVVQALIATPNAHFTTVPPKLTFGGYDWTHGTSVPQVSVGYQFILIGLLAADLVIVWTLRRGSRSRAGVEALIKS